MTNEGPRTFQVLDPVTITAPVALSVGLYALTGQGKTESSLRLAHGMQRVVGGRVFFADCDNGRGLHFCKGPGAMFPNVGYIDFPAPHNALDYVDLLAQMSREKGVLVIDNMSAEHEGEGGLIDTYEDAKQGKESRNAVAWGKAKAQHKKLVRAFVQANRTLPIIVTWRAQEKLDWAHKNDRGQTEPQSQGEMPIGSKDLPFEMTATYLLPAGSKGAPLLDPKAKGEMLMTKVPRWFEGIVRPGEKFAEAHGEAMARWAFATGSKKTAPPSDPGEHAEAIESFRARFRDADTSDAVNTIARELAKLPKGHPIRTGANAAYKAADARCKGELPPEAESPAVSP